MHIITCEDWTEETIGRDEYVFAPTSDPRVLAVLQRDEYASISELYDGDAINPIHYNDYRHGPHYVAGYDDDSAKIIARANDRLDYKDAERYLWIFHGIAYVAVNGGQDRDGDWFVVSSNEYRKHIGDEPYATRAEAIEDCLAIGKDLEDALDGYVYGIGFATNEARRLHDEEPIELGNGDWEIEISCWGFVGEEYAKREAASFGYEEPSLPEMIEVSA